MKNKRFQHAYRKSASKLHKAVGNCLRNDKPFGNFTFYQEYHVNRVNKDYENGSHKFDWVCPQLNIVIECHGKQHYEVVDFGYDAPEKAIEAFRDGQRRDKAKKNAALAAGFIYIEIPYTMEKEITSSKIQELFSLGTQELEVYTKENKKRFIGEYKKRAVELAEEKKAKDKELRKQYLESDRHKEQLEKAKEYRQQQYKKLKELKRNAQ